MNQNLTNEWWTPPSIISTYESVLLVFRLMTLMQKIFSSPYQISWNKILEYYSKRWTMWWSKLVWGIKAFNRCIRASVKAIVWRNESWALQVKTKAINYRVSQNSHKILILRHLGRKLISINLQITWQCVLGLIDKVPKFHIKYGRNTDLTSSTMKRLDTLAVLH